MGDPNTASSARSELPRFRRRSIDRARELPVLSFSNGRFGAKRELSDGAWHRSVPHGDGCAIDS